MHFSLVNDLIKGTLRLPAKYQIELAIKEETRQTRRKKLKLNFQKVARSQILTRNR